MSNCKVHQWRMPKIGEEALVCEVPECERSLEKPLDFALLSVNMMASIVNSIERRKGPGPADEFRAALHAAYGKWKGRNDND